VLRVDAGMAAMLEPIVRDAVARVNPDLPVPRMRSQTRVMEETSAKERVFSQILTVVAAFALLLASIGLYGVTSYSVERRTSEIGVRVALGARPDQILRMILVRVLVLTLFGLAVGIPAALAVGPIVASLLYGVTPSDAMSVAIAAAFLLAVALTAGFLPALRAARLEALVALRSE
jgi:ABC-type antimicrobial peptide transport system permease subunit